MLITKLPPQEEYLELRKLHNVTTVSLSRLLIKRLTNQNANQWTHLSVN